MKPYVIPSLAPRALLGKWHSLPSSTHSQWRPSPAGTLKAVTYGNELVSFTERKLAGCQLISSSEFTLIGYFSYFTGFCLQNPKFTSLLEARTVETC